MQGGASGHWLLLASWPEKTASTCFNKSAQQEPVCFSFPTAEFSFLQPSMQDLVFHPLRREVKCPPDAQSLKIPCFSFYFTVFLAYHTTTMAGISEEEKFLMTVFSVSVCLTMSDFKAAKKSFMSTKN